ncbi:MAG: hypothetical protein ACRC7O_00535 [Fimbriiglobus sp.]
MMPPLLYDRGRGPELRSCRITVYDLIPYLLSPTYSDALMFEAWPSITPAELAALKQYIADHRDEVMAVHDRIEARMQDEMAIQATPEFQNRRWWNRERIASFRAWQYDLFDQIKAENGGVYRSHPDVANVVREFRAWYAAQQPVEVPG